MAAPGSLVWNDLLTVLRLHKHSESPSAESALISLNDIDRVCGSAQDFFSPFWSTPASIEREGRYIRSLLQRLGMEEPLGQFKATLSGDLTQKPLVSTSARKEIWPALRQHGFTEFTERVARRRIGNAVQLLAFEPMDRREEKQRSLPKGFFHICAGVFWLDLAATDETRPKLRDCQLQACLTSSNGETTAFASAEEAVRAIESDGLGWLSFCQDVSAMAQLLDNPEWKIFASWPTMRGQGAHGSVPRFLLRAMLAHRQGDRGRTDEYLAEARAAVGRSGEGIQPYYQEWVDRVAAKLS